MTAEATTKIFDGCTEHRVGTMDVNARWKQLEGAGWNGRAAMCRCCYAPCLVDSYDARGVGQGELLCSRCRPLTEGAP